MKPTLSFDTGAALAAIPVGLRVPLVEVFTEILRNFQESRWEPAELNGGKFCEVVYTILRGYGDGSFPDKPSKPSNMVDACKALERFDETKVPRAIRIQIPRMLIALYEVRNQRGVGHIGGDVDPNQMDAVLVLEMAKWIMADLVRVFHNIDTTAATQIVAALVERRIPLVWEVAGNRRVLDSSLSYKEKLLVLLYSHPGPVRDADLLRWIEHSNPSVFRRDVLAPAHKQRLVEYSRPEGLVYLSPLGTKYVEENVDLHSRKPK